MCKLSLIAIDGPSGVGKSTTAKLVADELSWSYLDTGAMYRAIALMIIISGSKQLTLDGLNKLLDDTDINQVDGIILLNGFNVSSFIRMPQITLISSLISSISRIREFLVSQQRKICSTGCWVVEGRDIGSVVFPNACCKIYLTADITIRAARRFKELRIVNNEVELPQVMLSLRDRDLADSTRELSPLCKAHNAIELDSSNMSLSQVSSWIIVNHVSHI